MANIYDSVFDGHSAAHSHYVALSETSGEPIFSITPPLAGWRIAAMSEAASTTSGVMLAATSHDREA